VSTKRHARGALRSPVAEFNQALTFLAPTVACYPGAAPLVAQHGFAWARKSWLKISDLSVQTQNSSTLDRQIIDLVGTTREIDGTP
jgi:hypothetical protein